MAIFPGLIKVDNLVKDFFLNVKKKKLFLLSKAILKPTDAINPTMVSPLSLLSITTRPRATTFNLVTQYISVV